MFLKFINTLIVVFASLIVTAQVTTNPALPVARQKVIITFDSSKESRLGYYTGELYTHTGLITDKSSNNDDWKYVIGTWGDNTKQPKLTHKGNGIYDLEISPDIIQFYTVTGSDKILKIAFVFRSDDSKKQTNNLYVTVYPEGLSVDLVQPANNSILAKNQQVAVSANSSETSDMKLLINNNTISQNTGTTISANYSFTQSGNFLVIAEATANGKTVRDTSKVFIREDVIVKPKPTSYRSGINYTSASSVALVLWARKKESVFVIGDFNNWQVNNTYQMYKDGDYFWIEITNLEPGREYMFQYLIDGKIKIADPYCEKISDPWNDKYIPAETYPNLIVYPAGKTDGIASVFQTNQQKFNWQVANFQPPSKEKLIIYELLVRDFLEEHSYKSVREKLDYLQDLRVNAIELMPVNEFEGNNSWGYNPSFYFAPDKYYGPKDELKKLIDECHKRGIAVIIDMVLNHSYGQSPFVQMYMDNWKVTSDNPWYNMESNFQNTNLQWGYDFNHESLYTRELVDSVNSFWMSEYKIDGFRFDFTKGFSNTPYSSSSWGSEYDAARIANLKRMSDEIRKRKNDALIIFEHLSENSEEKELANYGIMLWGNMHGSYLEAARGNTGSSDLSWGIYSKRGWNSPNLVAFPESHDEERIMYTVKLTGLSNDSYNIKNQQTALKRIELNSVFYIPLPGPRMIWQFGERGYDQSINRCTDGTISSDCRLSPKPPYWQYLENPNRTALFQVMAKLNELKQKYNEFTPENFETELTGAVKWYRLTTGSNHVVALGNFDIIQKSASITFPKTGKWYEFFSRDSVQISTANQTIPLAPGEYRLYSTRKFDDPHVITENKTEFNYLNDVLIYPNPALEVVNISAAKPIINISLYSVSGEKVKEIRDVQSSQTSLNIDDLKRGMYFIKVTLEGTQVTLKLAVQK